MKETKSSIVSLASFFSLPIPPYLRPLPARGSCCSLLLRLSSRLSGSGRRRRTRRRWFPRQSSAVAGHREVLIGFFSEGERRVFSFSSLRFTLLETTRVRVTEESTLSFTRSLTRARASPVLTSECARTHQSKRCARWKRKAGGGRKRYSEMASGTEKKKKSDQTS